MPIDVITRGEKMHIAVPFLKIPHTAVDVYRILVFAAGFFIYRTVDGPLDPARQLP